MDIDFVPSSSLYDQSVQMIPDMMNLKKAAFIVPHWQERENVPSKTS
jgi:hypothetical protein